MSDLTRVLLDALDEDGLALLAERLAPYLQPRLEPTPGSDDPWMDSRAAADYLGVTPNALHKLTAERALPFEQEGPGCKVWFRRSSLDAWREAGGARAHHRAPPSSARPPGLARLPSWRGRGKFSERP